MRRLAFITLLVSGAAVGRAAAGQRRNRRRRPWSAS